MITQLGLLTITGAAMLVCFHFRKTGIFTLIGGSLLLLGGLISHSLLSDGFHFVLMARGTFLMPLIGAVIMLVLLYGNRDDDCRTISPLILFVTILALVSPLPDTKLSLKLEHFSAPAFFLTEALSNVLFASSSCLAIGAILKKKNLPEPLTGTLLLAGFIFFSLCQLLGAWWAWLGWGTPFHWSHRHLIGASIWCSYAGALHLRFTTWSCRTRSWFLALSIIPLAFPYIFRIVKLIEPLLKGVAR